MGLLLGWSNINDKSIVCIPIRVDMIYGTCKRGGHNGQQLINKSNIYRHTALVELPGQRRTTNSPMACCFVGLTLGCWCCPTPPLLRVILIQCKEIVRLVAFRIFVYSVGWGTGAWIAVGEVGRWRSSSE